MNAHLAILATTLVFYAPMIVTGVLIKDLLDRFWFKIGWLS
jgi:hypothetical protein